MAVSKKKSVSSPKADPAPQRPSAPGQLLSREELESLSTLQLLDLIASNHFSKNEPDVFEPILDTLLGNGDHYLHLADLKSYSQAHARLGDLYKDQEGWTRKTILNIAASGRFSSDRTIAEYAKEIWQVKPCLVD